MVGIKFFFFLVIEALTHHGSSLRGALHVKELKRLVKT